MNSMTNTEPVVTHPTWCVPNRCSEDRTAGSLHDVTHFTEDQSITLGIIECTTALASIDRYTGSEPNRPSSPYIMSNDVEGDVSADDLEAFGLWLIARAAEYRQAIATEGGAR